MDYNHNRFWIAIGRCGAFNETDPHIFRVWPKDENLSNSKAWDLMPKFVDAKSAEDARNKIHWFIDTMFNKYYVPSDKDAGTYQAPVVVPTAPVESLTIGQEPSRKPDNDGLLNLGDLV